jgi:hypothetical protein
MQTTIQLLYKTISGNKKKERFETILEPLQALIQIALLSYYPIGSKLTIQNNILYIQAPSYGQSVTRWYNNDTQEDLFYLFNIFCRFKKFYTDIKVDNTELFTLLINLAKNGINNLIRTYNQTEKTHVLHTLQMYKNMLDGTIQNIGHNNNNNTPMAIAAIQPPSSIPNYYSTESHNRNHKTHKNNDNNERKNKTNSRGMGMGMGIYNTNTSDVSHQDNEKEKEKDKEKEKEMISISSTVSTSPEIDMDDIFIKISDLYSDEIFKIIYNTFIEIERDDTNLMDYANGLNMILHPVNVRIKKWIDENIVF